MDVLDTLIFHPRLRRGLKLALYTGITLFLAKEAAAAFWLTALPPTAGIDTTYITPQARPAATGARATATPMANYAALQKSTLFGRSADMATGDLTAEAVKVETTLNALLTGTIMGTPPTAYVWDNTTNKTLTVREGDTPIPGVTVQKIERRRVLINNKGKAEVLNMKTAELTPHGNGSGLVNTSSAPLAYEQEAGKKLTTSMTRAEVQTALGNLGELSAQARFIKRMNADGVHEGFTLMEVAHNSFISRLGLRDGDVLLKLDGIPVVARERLLPMMFALQNAQGAELTLLRGGEVLALDITVTE